MFWFSFFFSIKYLISLSLGQGIEGIIMNLLRYVILFFLSDNEKYYNLSTNIFLSVFVFILLITIFKFHSIKKIFFKKIKRSWR